jgi:hypothetical protein
MKLLLRIFSFILFFGCSDQYDYVERSNTAIENISIGDKEIIKKDLVKNAEFVFLDNSFLIGEIKRMIFFDDKIFLQDKITDRIIVYTLDGNYLFHIDSKGKGPNEYLEIDDFAIDKKSNCIIIYDSRRHQILTYSIHSRKFIDKQELSFYPTKMACVEDLLFFYNPYTFNYPKNKDFHYSLISTSKKTKIETKYFRVNTKIGNFLSNPNTQGFFYGDKITFLDRFDNIIYKIHKDSVFASCKVNFLNNKNFEKVLYNAIEKGTRNTELYHQCSTDIGNYCETNELIAFQYLRDKLVYYVVYSKIEKQLMHHSSYAKIFSETLFKKNIPFYIPPKMTYENKFISIIPSQLIVSFINNRRYYFKMRENMTDEILIDRLENVRMDDNPILVMYNYAN